jgi:Ca2+-binding EF-hand superfamily protein
LLSLITRNTPSPSKDLDSDSRRHFHRQNTETISQQRKAADQHFPSPVLRRMNTTSSHMCNPHSEHVTNTDTRSLKRKSTSAGNLKSLMAGSQSIPPVDESRVALSPERAASPEIATYESCDLDFIDNDSEKEKDKDKDKHSGHGIRRLLSRMSTTAPKSSQGDDNSVRDRHLYAQNSAVDSYGRNNSNGSDTISSAEPVGFSTIEYECFRDIVLRSGLPADMSSHGVFDIFDKNHTGKIDMKDFLLTMLAFRHATGGDSGEMKEPSESVDPPLAILNSYADTMDMYFDIFDIQQTGYIHINDLKVVVGCMTLDMSEFARSHGHQLCTMETAEALMRDIFVDEDGRVYYPEFQKLYTGLLAGGTPGCIDSSVDESLTNSAAHLSIKLDPSELSNMKVNSDTFSPALSATSYASSPVVPLSEWGRKSSVSNVSAIKMSQLSLDVSDPLFISFAEEDEVDKRTLPKRRVSSARFVSDEAIRPTIQGKGSSERFRRRSIGSTNTPFNDVIAGGENMVVKSRKDGESDLLNAWEKKAVSSR